MLILCIVGSLIALAVGLAVKLSLDYAKSDYKVSWTEFSICAIAIVLLVAPLVSWIGEKAAFSNQITYHENWGGYETATNWSVTTCTEDGACVHTYDCDPYQQKVVDHEAYTDDKGKYHAEEYHYVTKYHDCPYTDEEWTFTVGTTVGDYTIASHNLPTDPDNHRWRSYHSVPDDIPSGIPEFWTQVKARIAAGTPGPVTARRDYKNYILASQGSILHKFSGSIDDYSKAGLLPAIVSSINPWPYYENRVYPVGVSLSGNWEDAINRFDAAIGASLQGDLHLVIVDANKVTNPDDYAAALTAYWQSPKFGKDALSKNGIVVVLGTRDGHTVAWARATTGMPAGNEDLVLDVQNQLVGASLTPAAILGSPTATITGGNGSYQVAVHHTNGALDKALMTGAHPFARVCMVCAANGETGTGYTYLKNEIQPTGGQKFWIAFFVVFFSCLIWAGAVYFALPAHRNFRNN